jgi:hypothetical protein
MQKTNNARHTAPHLSPSELARREALRTGRAGEYALPGEYWGLPRPERQDYSRPTQGVTTSGLPIRLGRH